MVTETGAPALIPLQLVGTGSGHSSQENVPVVSLKIDKQLSTLIAGPDLRVARALPRSAIGRSSKQPPPAARAEPKRNHGNPPIDGHRSHLPCYLNGSSLLPNCDRPAKQGPQIQGFCLAALRGPAVYFALQFVPFRSFALRFLPVETAGIEPASAVA
jgi:hypothetical protein